MEKLSEHILSITEVNKHPPFMVLICEEINYNLQVRWQA